MNARMSARAASRWLKAFGSLCSRASRTRSNWAFTASASSWSYTVWSSVFLTHGHELLGVADMRLAEQ